MWWYVNVSCTTLYVSSICMIHNTGHYSISNLLDWSIITLEHGSIYVAVHGGACSVDPSITEYEMIIEKTECLKWLLWLLNLKWLSWKQNVWNDYYNDRVSFEIAVTFICFPEKSIWYCPKLRTEFWYWNTSARWIHFQVRQRSCFEAQLRLQ